jgi:hypothetical protein
LAWLPLSTDLPAGAPLGRSLLRFHGCDLAGRNLARPPAGRELPSLTSKL